MTNITLLQLVLGVQYDLLTILLSFLENLPADFLPEINIFIFLASPFTLAPGF